MYPFHKESNIDSTLVLQNIRVLKEFDLNFVVVNNHLLIALHDFWTKSYSFPVSS